MPRSIYSTRFIQEHVASTGPSSRYVVPDGRIAIVRQITVVPIDPPGGLSDVVLYGSGPIALWRGQEVASFTSRIVSELHIVVPSGDWVEFACDPGGVDVSLHGYLLTE